MDDQDSLARRAQAVVQESALHQAAAAATAAYGLPHRQQNPPAMIQTDLLTPDLGEQDEPPPAYPSDHRQGDPHPEKVGLQRDTRITDDGRVDVRITELGRRLSQLFSPALRQQVQASRHEAVDFPPPYAATTSTGPSAKSAATVPPLNIVIQVVGSRGDVQPFIALGNVLRAQYGHRVRIATHPVFKDFVLEHGHGLEFFSIGGDPANLMSFMAKNDSLMPGFKSIWSGDVGKRRRDVGQYIQGCWRSCYETGDGISAPETDSGPIDSASTAGSSRPFVADAIIANPPSFAHIHCAEKLGVPLHIMFTMPYSPTQAFPHPLAKVQASSTDPQMANFISYAMIEMLSWQGLGDIINRFRKKCLGLEPVSSLWGPGMLQRLRIPHTYLWSPALIPKPKDWGPQISVAGFSFMPSIDYTPSPDLQAFLDGGPPPIYVGFGSIVLEDPDAMTRLIFEVIERTGQRCLLSQGWGGIGAGRVPEGVFMLGSVPHDWLFQHVSCVVHHGGAGTTSAGISAGRPTVIVPFFGDQHFWGATIARTGAGPDPIPFKDLSPGKLANAVSYCLEPATRKRAEQLAKSIAGEQGDAEAAQIFHQHLGVDKLRCTLVPSRSAVWRIRRTKVRLSAFAACTLVNAGLLEFKDLKPFRAQEHYTDEGPVDPLSGAFAACMRAINGMALGLVEVPTESFKVVQAPLKLGQQMTRASAFSSSLKGKERARPSASRSSLSNEHDTSSIDDFKSSRSLRSNTNPTPESSTAARQRPHLQHMPASAPPNQKDMLRKRVPHVSQGIGRTTRSFVRSVPEVSVSLTRGVHNLPKLWGDDTVRPQERVTDMRTGMRALGREFAFGYYDSLSGLVTQPMKGAQQEGVSGFFKGLGKGFGGLLTKLSAAHLGILSHTMQGVHKEIQKLFADDVSGYIAASRATQGYEEWLRSSDAEKQDVIDRWQLIEELVWKRKSDNRINEAMNNGQSLDAGTASLFDSASVRSTTASAPVTPAHFSGFGTSSDTGAGDYQFTPKSASSSPRTLSSISSTIARRSLTLAADDGLDGSLPTSPLIDEDGELSRAPTLPAAETAERQKSILRRKPLPVTASSSTNAASPADGGHVAGTTQERFEADQQRCPGEKTAEELEEDEMVMRYIKKQSMREAELQARGKRRTRSTEVQEEEELQRAMQMSLDTQSRCRGEAEDSDEDFKKALELSMQDAGG